MPIYEYVCATCGDKSDHLMRLSDPDPDECPKCGPAVLTRAGMDEIDDRHGNRTLREGLAAAMRAGEMPKLPLAALTAQLGAMFDRAALAIEAGAGPKEHRAVLAAVIDGLTRPPAR